MSHFVDSNFGHCNITECSTTGTIHMLNKTPIEWFIKRQSTVKTSTYDTEFVSARTCTEQIISLRYQLRMMGIPIDGPSYMFGDNEGVVKSSTIPEGNLKKRHNANSFHCVREAIVAKIIHFIHIDGKLNPADVLTKNTPRDIWWSLLKPIIHWYSPK